MTILSSIANVARTIASLPAVLTGAKGFDGRGAIASPALNAAGLHRWRVATAARMTAQRRRKLAQGVPEEWRSDFDRQGFVLVEDAMPEADFAAMKRKLLEREWPVREMVQGDTITRRAAVNPAMLEAVPELAKFLKSDRMRGLTAYVAASRIEPLYYVQVILRRPAERPDPQTALHADTFHSSMKCWLFLGDVAADDGPFTYVPGSHRVDAARLDWEQARAEELVRGEGDRLSRRGSLRVERGDLDTLGLPAPRGLACRANSLVVADTLGFHARGPSGPDIRRIEIWGYARRNPFLPFTGIDPLGFRGIAERRVDWLWSMRDRWPKWLKQPWKDKGPRYLASDHEGRI